MVLLTWDYLDIIPRKYIWMRKVLNEVLVITTKHQLTLIWFLHRSELVPQVMEASSGSEGWETNKYLKF